MNGVTQAARERQTAAASTMDKSEKQIVAGRAASHLETVGATIIALGDIGALVVAAWLAMTVRLGVVPYFWPNLARELPPELTHHMAWVLLVALACFVYEKLYVRRQSFWPETRVIVKALTLTTVIAFAGVGLAKLSSEVSRSVLLLWYLFSLLLVPAVRYCVKLVAVRSGLWREPVLIMGAGKTGELVIKGINGSPYMGLAVAALLDDDPAKRVEGITVDGRHYRVSGGFDDAPNIIRSHNIRNVIIAAPGMAGKDQVELVNRLQPLVRTVSVVPDLFGIPVASGELTYFFNEGLLAYRHRNNLAYPANRALKRAFDLVLGTIALIVVSPVMVAIALAVKLTSRGPVMFSHRRIGMGGKEFMCHKFRTMVLNNDEILRKYLEENPDAREEFERFAKLRGYDPRMTPIGAFLRKWSLDELPQLLNVIKGDMSLVGPRPYLPRELPKMGSYLPIMTLARPGITGLWQVSGRNEIDFEGRLELESRYIRNWSLWLDITLLFRTIPAVLKRDGAY